LITGKVTDLLPPTMWATWGGRVGPINWWSQSFYPQVRLSPDSSRAVFTLQTTGGNEADLYTVRTDGTYLHQLTRNPNPSSDYTAWTPVKWSSDGTRILANRTAFEGSQIHFITVSDGDDKFVTNGYAVQWLERP
jgi:Tol biopolymer transport system component